jgi:hypothetical protein
MLGDDMKHMFKKLYRDKNGGGRMLSKCPHKNNVSTKELEKIHNVSEKDASEILGKVPKICNVRMLAKELIKIYDKHDGLKEIEIINDKKCIGTFKIYMDTEMDMEYIDAKEKSQSITSSITESIMEYL